MTIEQRILDIRIDHITPLISPIQLRKQLSISEQSYDLISGYRDTVIDILNGKDPRMLAIVGPCSIHEQQAAKEYAHRLKELSLAVSDKLFVIMRVYFEKPRTTIGWKGLINDPDLNNQCDMSKGLFIARSLLRDIVQIGLPAATEMLDPYSPQYTADLITWASIGARTTESQTHREMSSGLSMPVGYKNGTDGSIDVALGAMQAALHSHSFIGIDGNGQTVAVCTKGNPHGHLILRGGRVAPNYDPTTIQFVIGALEKAHLNSNVIIDCSHANSQKDYRQQSSVLHNIIDQRVQGNSHIVGFMLESNLFEGNQSISKDLSLLKYGVSVTDACMGWDETHALLTDIYRKL